MRRLAHWPLLAVLGVALLMTAMTTIGCGGPEFVASPDDAGLTTDGSSPDGTVKADGSTLKDGAPGASDGSEAGEAHDAGDSGKGTTDGGDAATTSDGGDAGPVVFACPSPDPTVVFCSGFDKQTTPPWEWASDPITPKAGETVDTVNYLSPPNSFAALNKLLLAVADNAQIASLGQPFTSLANHIHYVFHMFVKQYDANDNPPIPVAQLTVGPATSASFSLQLVLKGGQLSLAQLFTGADGGQQTTSTPVGTVATGAWTRVELLLDRSAVNWLAYVYLNGAKAITAQTAVTPSNQSLEVDLGILLIIPPSTANAIFFDNVTVRAF